MCVAPDKRALLDKGNWYKLDHPIKPGVTHNFSKGDRHEPAMYVLPDYVWNQP